MQDGVCQRLAKRQLNGKFAARITMNFPNLEHQFIDERRNRINFTLHRKLQVQVGPPRVGSRAASYWCYVTDSSRAGVPAGLHCGSTSAEFRNHRYVARL